MFITGYTELVNNKSTYKVYGSLDFLLQEIVAWFNAPLYGYKKFKEVYNENILRDWGLGNGYYSPEFRKLKGDTNQAYTVLKNKLTNQADDIHQDDYSSINSKNLNKLIEIIGFEKVVGTGLLTARTIKYFSADQLNGLSSDNFLALVKRFGLVGGINSTFGDNVFSGLSKDKFNIIQRMCWDHPVSSEFDALSDTQVGWLYADTLSALALSDIKFISNRVIGNMTGAQLSSQSSAWLQSLSALQVASIAADPYGNNAFKILGSRVGQFSVNQLVYLNRNQLLQFDAFGWAGLTRDKRSIILTIGGGSLNGVLLSKLTAEEWALVSIEQIVNLTISQIQAFSASTFQAIAPEKIWVMTIDQLKAIGSKNIGLSFMAVAGLTLNQYRALTGFNSQSGISASPLTLKPLYQMTPTDLQAISVADFMRLPARALAELSVAQLTRLTRAQVINLSNVQTSGFSAEQINALSTTPVATMDAGTFANLSSDDIKSINASTMASVTKDDIAMMSSDAVQKLTQEQVQSIKTFSQFTEAEFKKFTATQLAWFTTDQLIDLNANEDARRYLVKAANWIGGVPTALALVKPNEFNEPSVTTTGNRNSYVTSTVVRANVALATLGTFQMVENFYTYENVVQPKPITSDTASYLDQISNYKAGVKASRNLGQVFRFLSTAQSGFAVASIMYQAEVDKHDKVKYNKDIVKIVSIIASTSQVPVFMISKWIADYYDGVSKYLKTAEPYKDYWNLLYDETIKASTQFDYELATNSSYRILENGVVNDSIIMNYANNSESWIRLELGGPYRKSLGTMLDEYYVSKGKSVDHYELNEVKSFLNDKDAEFNYGGIYEDAQYIKDYLNGKTEYDELDMANLNKTASKLVAEKAEAKTRAVEKFKVENKAEFDLAYSNTVKNADKDVAILSEWNSSTMEKLCNSKEIVINDNNVAETLQTRISREKSLGGSADMAGWNAVRDGDIFIGNEGAGTALHTSFNKMINGNVPTETMPKWVDGNKSKFTIENDALLLPTYKESFATTAEIFNYKNWNGAGWKTRFAPGVSYFAANVLGLAVGITTLVEATRERRVDPAGLIGGSLNIAGATMVLTSDLLDLLIGGRAAQVALVGETTVASAAAVKIAASRLLGPGLMLMMVGGMAQQITAAGIKQSKDSSYINGLVLGLDIAGDAVILGSLILASVYGGPLALLGATIISVTIPNFDAMGTAWDLEGEQKRLENDGRYTQASITNQFKNMAYDQAAPFVNWGQSTIMARTMRRIYGIMHGENAFINCLREDFASAMRKDNQFESGIVQGLKNQIFNVNKNSGQKLSGIKFITGQAADSDAYWVTNSDYYSDGVKKYFAQYASILDVASNNTDNTIDTDKGKYKLSTDAQWTKQAIVINANVEKQRQGIQITAEANYVGTMIIDASRSTEDLSVTVFNNAAVKFYSGKANNTYVLYLDSTAKNNFHIEKNSDINSVDVVRFIAYDKASTEPASDKFALKTATVPVDSATIIDLNNFGSSTYVFGTNGLNRVSGSLSDQIYSFNGGTDEIKMTGGRSDVSVAGRGTIVTLANGNNMLHSYLGYETNSLLSEATYDGGVQVLPTYVWLDGPNKGKSFGAEYEKNINVNEISANDRLISEMTATGENTINFSGSFYGLKIKLTNQAEWSTATTIGEPAQDTAKFKNFANLIGSSQGDNITISDATDLHEIRLGLGANDIVIKNSSALAIYYTGPLSNHIYILNSEVAVSSVSGVANIYLMSQSKILANFQGVNDVLSATDESAKVVNISTGVGTHTLSLDHNTVGSISLMPTVADNRTILIDVKNTGRVLASAASDTSSAVSGGMLSVQLGCEITDETVSIDSDGSAIYFSSTNGMNQQFVYKYADGSLLWDADTQSVASNANYIALNYTYDSYGKEVISIASIARELVYMLGHNYSGETLRADNHVALTDVLDHLLNDKNIEVDDYNENITTWESGYNVNFNEAGISGAIIHVKSDLTSINLNANGVDVTVDGTRGAQINFNPTSQAPSVAGTVHLANAAVAQSMGRTVNLLSSGVTSYVTFGSAGDIVNLSGASAVLSVNGSGTGTINFNAASETLNVGGDSSQITVGGTQAGAINLNAANQTLTVAEGVNASTVVVNGTGQTVNLQGASATLGAVTLNSTGATVNVNGEIAVVTVSGTQAGTIKLNAVNDTLTVADTAARASTVEVNGTGQKVNLQGASATLGAVTLSSTGATVNLSGASAVLSVNGSGTGTINFNAASETLNVDGASAEITVSGTYAGAIKLNAADQTLTVADTAARASTVEVKSTGQTVNLKGGSATLGAVTLSSTGATVNLSGASAVLSVSGWGDGTINFDATGQTLNVDDVLGITVSGSQAGTIKLNAFAQVLTLADTAAKTSTVEAKNMRQFINLQGASAILGAVTFSSLDTTVNLNGDSAVLTINGSGSGTINFNADNQTLNLDGVSASLYVVGAAAGTINLNADSQRLVVSDTAAQSSAVVVSHSGQEVSLWGTSGALGAVTLSGTGSTVDLNGESAVLSVLGSGDGTINLNAASQTLNVDGASAQITVSGTQAGSINLNAANQIFTVADTAAKTSTVVVNGTGQTVNLQGAAVTLGTVTLNQTGATVNLSGASAVLSVNGPQAATIHLNAAGQILTVADTGVKRSTIVVSGTGQTVNLQGALATLGNVTLSSTGATVNVVGVHSQLTVNGSGSGTIKLNSNSQTLTVANMAATSSSVELNGQGQTVNFNGASGATCKVILFSSVINSTTTLNLQGTGAALNVNANNVVGKYTAKINMLADQQNVLLKYGSVYATSEQVTRCSINGNTYNVNNAVFSVDNNVVTLVSGSAQLILIPPHIVQANTIIAPSYQEVLVSHSSQSTDFDQQGAMPTQDYFSMSEANDKIANLIVNEQEIFNPNYLFSKISSDFYGDFINDPTIQLDNMNQRNVWTSGVNAPSLAGYSCTVSAQAWDNSQNRDLGAAAYITTRAYQ